MYPKALKNLIESFKLLPGIGEKSAERLALFTLNMDEENALFFSDSIKNAISELHKCQICNNITDQDVCQICQGDSRDIEKLCIVEDVKSLYMFEKSGVYNGYYYILDNLISPLDGINPEDIGIEKLIKFIKNKKFKEIIIAVKPSIEGETTSLYIKRILEDSNLKITRIASGIPIGADIEYRDSLTLERALHDRKEIE